MSQPSYLDERRKARLARYRSAVEWLRRRGMKVTVSEIANKFAVSRDYARKTLNAIGVTPDKSQVELDLIAKREQDQDLERERSKSVIYREVKRIKRVLKFGLSTTSGREW